MAIVRYAGNRMTGVSGDTKPTEGSLITGTTFHETNTDDLYIWDGDSWELVASGTALRVKEISAPGNQATNYGVIYVDTSDEKLYFKFESDTAIDLTAGSAGGEANESSFKTISVSGQDNVVADSDADTLTLVAGSNITLTTNASTDTVTIASATGVSALDGLSDVTIASVADAHVLLYDNGDSRFENKAISGDITISAAGVAAITSDVIVNADVKSDAAIAMSKTALVAGTGITLATNTLNVDAAQTQITSVGALNAGSITSGFGAIDTGSSNITTTGTVTVGNLVVNGTSTKVDVSVLTVVDPIIHLQTAAGGGNLSSDTNKDVGIAMEYHNGSAAKEAFLGWDDSAGKLTFIPDASISSEVVSGSVGTIVANLEGNVTGDTSGSSGSTTGNAVTATALATGRTISASGDITWTSASFNGSANVTSVAAITADVIVNADIKSDAAIADSKLANISTANKVNIAALDIDGATEIGAAIVDADVFIIDDGAGGTNRKVLASRIKTYAASASGASESFAIAMAVAL